jgi:hypothetical protein
LKETGFSPATDHGLCSIHSTTKNPIGLPEEMQKAHQVLFAFCLFPLLAPILKQDVQVDHNWYFC